MPDPQTSDPRYPTSDAPWQGPRQPLDAGTVVTGLSATTPRYPRTILPTLPTTGRPDTPLPNPELQQSLWQRITHDPIGAATEAIRGAVVGGGGDTQAAKAGELAMAAMPLVGGAKALVTGRNALTAGEEAAQGIRAYHGSAADFNKFDLSKTGTGQGAASYGHGLYFAQAEPVALDMRNQLAPRPKILLGEDRIEIPATLPGYARTLHEAMGIRDAPIEQIVAARIASKVRELRSSGGRVATPVSTALDMINAELENGMHMAISRKDQPLYESLSHQQTTLQRMRDQGIDVPQAGHMYEVNLKVHPDELLDWDKPVADQPHVLDALRSARIKLTKSGMPIGERGAGLPGGQAYQLLSEQFNPSNTWQAEGEAAQGASEHLLSHGIPGAQYLDQFSRQLPDVSHLQARLADLKSVNAYAPSRELAQKIRETQQMIAGTLVQPKTRNLVMYTDSLIDILRKYAVLPPLAAGAAYGASRNQVGTPPPVQPPPR